MKNCMLVFAPLDPPKKKGEDKKVTDEDDEDSKDNDEDDFHQKMNNFKQ